MKTCRTAFRFTLLQAALLAGFAHGQDTVVLDEVHIEGRRNAARYAYTADAEKTQTATKTAADVATVPQSVSVVTRRHLDEREPQDVAETLAYTAGASGGYRGENGAIEMTVRGIRYKSAGGGEPTYINGLRYWPSLEINPYVIDRIETLKGPASVLYGQANPGGIVNLSLKEATGSNENEIMLKTGSGKRMELQADFDRELNDQFALRMVGAAKQMDWQAGNNARQRAFTLAPSLRWRPDEKTELVLNALYENQPEAGDRNFLLKQGTIDAVDGQHVGHKFFAGDPNFHDFNNRKAQISYRFSHDFGNNVSIHQNVRYGKYNDYWKTLVVWDPGAGSEMVRRARIFDTDWRDFLADTRVQWKPNFGQTQHNIIVGLDYTDRRNDLYGRLGSAPSIDWRNPVYGVYVGKPPLSNDETVKMRQTGVYLQDQISRGGWHFLIGGRYDRSKSKSEDRRWNEQSSQSDGKFTWRTGLLYRFDNGISPYVSYSTSFIPEAGKAADGNNLKPSTAVQVEAGIKYQPNPALLMTASVFDISQKNLVVRDPVTFDKSQIGKIRTRGAEIEVQGDITPAWGISGSYTFLGKKIRQDSVAANIGTTSWGVPRHSFSLWSDYRFSGALQGISAGVGLRHTGKTWGDDANTFRVPAYTLWDMKIAYKPGTHFPALKGSTVQLNVQNIGNKEYVASCAGTYSCFYGKGRVWTLSAGYRW